MYFFYNKNGINFLNFLDFRLLIIVEDWRLLNFFLKFIIYVRKDIDFIEGYFRVILFVVVIVFFIVSIIISVFVCVVIRLLLFLRVCFVIVIIVFVCKIMIK